MWGLLALTLATATPQPNLELEGYCKAVTQIMLSKKPYAAEAIHDLALRNDVTADELMKACIMLEIKKIKEGR